MKCLSALLTNIFVERSEYSEVYNVYENASSLTSYIKRESRDSLFNDSFPYSDGKIPSPLTFNLKRV